MTEKGLHRFLALMTCVHFVNDGFEMVVPTLLPAMALSLGLSYAEIGIVGSALVVAMGLGQAFVGAFSDYFGHKKLIIFLGVFSTSVAFLLMSISDSFIMLVAANLLAGFGLSIYHPVGIAMITNMFSSRQGKAIGIHGVGGNLGMFLFPIIAGVLADLLGWRTTLAIFPMIGIFITIIYLIRCPEEDVDLSGFEPRKLLVPALAIIIISGGLLNIAMRGFITFFPVTVRELGASSSVVGGYLSIYFGMGALGQYIGGWLSDNRDILRSILLFGSIATVSMYLTISYPETAIMYVFLALAGLTENLLWPLFYVLYARHTPKEMRGTGLGVFFSMAYLFAATSPVIMGSVAHHISLESSYLVILAAGAAGSIFILFVRLARR